MMRSERLASGALEILRSGNGAGHAALGRQKVPNLRYTVAHHPPACAILCRNGQGIRTQIKDLGSSLEFF